MEKLKSFSIPKMLLTNDSRVLNTYGYYLLLVLLFCFSLTLIIIGVVYLRLCEVADFIPIYLFILGLYGIVEQIIYFASLYGNKTEHPAQSIWVLVRSFMIGLFVWGSVEFYDLGTPNFDSSKGPHCNKTLYLFTYWVNTIAWITIVLIIVITCMITLIFNFKSHLFKWNQELQI